jgi:hypothetical protein
VANRTTLKRSPFLSIATPWRSARRAWSILPSSFMLPLVSMTKTTSLGATCCSAACWRGAKTAKKVPSSPGGRVDTKEKPTASGLRPT